MQIVREVERDILRREQQKREEEALIHEVKIVKRRSRSPNLNPPLQVKAAWLADLEELIERISAKFSAHFASMGFAGQVSVKRFVGSDKSSLHAQAIKLDAQKSFSLNDTGHNSRRPCLTHSSVFTFPRCSFTEASLRMILRTMGWTSW